MQTEVRDQEVLVQQ